MVKDNRDVDEWIRKFYASEINNADDFDSFQDNNECARDAFINNGINNNDASLSSKKLQTTN